GRGIAMTNGDWRRLGGFSGASPLPKSRDARCWRSSWTHDVAAGDQTSGRTPSALSSQPCASAVSAAPEAFCVTFTSMHSPLDVTPLLLKVVASSVRSADFSCDAATFSLTHAPRADGSGDDLNPKYPTIPIARKPATSRLRRSREVCRWYIVTTSPSVETRAPRPPTPRPRTRSG